jgi:hypothetical protein
MDEELKAHLEAMETRLTGRINATYQALGEVRTDLMALMNNQHERLLNDLSGLRGDFQNTKGFLLNDAATRGRQWLDLEDRVTKLERDK